MVAIQIQIYEAKVERPRTMALKGFIGQIKFYGVLEGANLRIDSPHTLSEEQVKEFEKKLWDLFPPERKFVQKEIENVLKKPPIMFSV